MGVFKRGDVYWYKFKFAGVVIRQTTRSNNKEVALRAERARRRQLELGANHLDPVVKPQMLSLVIPAWLESNGSHWAANSIRINKTNCAHLLPFFGKMLVNEISPAAIGRYQGLRTKEDAAPKTVNLEVATLRQILRSKGFWSELQGKVKMLRVRQEVGRALTPDEMMRIDIAAQKTRSRSLPVALVLYRFTGMRLSELRLMQWRQVDLVAGHLIVGKGKTQAGEGRKIPLASKALRTLLEWRAKFPDSKSTHYVFPSERYGLDGENGYKDGNVSVYAIDPTKPISSWKTAWTTCRKLAKVDCRTHDYRHSFVSRLAEDPSVSDATMMALTGHVSKRMLEHYSHTRVEAKQRAVELLLLPGEGPGDEELLEGAQKWAH